MSRYIDADKLANDIYRAWELWEKKGEDCYIFAEVITPLLVGQPTADVVEVVRCKDCKHKDYCCRNVAKFDKGYDMYEGISFCSYGERREDGEIH